MKRLKPFFSYFGAKWRLSPYYSIPKYNTIIEPFAGSACYSLYYHHKNIILVEKNPLLVRLWEFLIKSTKKDILDIPLINPDQLVEDLKTTEEGKLLVSFWLARASASPRRKPGGWMIKYPGQYQGSFWSDFTRNKVANQVQHIKHWRILEKDYKEVDNTEATWFIDPPYQIAGVGYTFGSDKIDYTDLSNYCKTRNGQVIVCENKGANWLDFKDFADCRGRVKMSKEVVWEK